MQTEVTRMENAAVANVLRGEGYRYCHTNLAEAGIYYKYYQEGFHIVMAVDLSGGNRFSVQQYRSMEEHAMDLFYHPQGRLGDFPDGFPVYHVEMLTLLIGGDSEVERKLCAECRNVWVYQPQSGRLLIYENQPGDFFDLRRALEQGVGGGGTGETSWHGTGTGGAGETSWHGAGTGAGDRRRCMEPEPVAGERRRGRVQVPHMRLHRIRQRTGWAFCGRTSGRNM